MAACTRSGSRLLICMLLGTCLAAGSPPAFAQADAVKYWIFFADKHESPRQQRVRPEVYLSPEAIERRRRRGSEIRSQDDRPVSSVYIDRLRRRGIIPIVTSRWFNAVSAYLARDEIAAVRHLPFVRKVQPVGRRASAPPDPRERSVRGKRPSPGAARGMTLNYGPSRFQLSMMNAVSPLEQGYNGEGVIVGFLDTKFDFEHPALRHIKQDGRLLEEPRDFTEPLADSTGVANDNYHGLSVASTAVGHDPGSLIGPAYGAYVLAATTEYAPRERNQEEDFFVAGMEWLERKGADVVNVSLGYTTFDSGQADYTYEDMDGNTAVSTRAADRAVSKGVVVVASAGNEGCESPEECWYYISAPADGDSVIAVGAVQPDSAKAFFSSFGPTYDGRTKPDVSALGTTIGQNDVRLGVYVARPSESNPYVYSAGTSFSSPLVTGVVAQMLQANPALRPIEVRQVLRETASRAGSPNNALGWGIVNAAAAVNRVRQLSFPDGAELTAAHPNPFAASTTITINVPAEQTERAHLTLYDILGREVAVPFAGTLVPGPNTISIDGTNLPSGIYLYRLVTTSFIESGTIVRAR